MLNNTIVALSTPFMESAIAVIRLSGNDAINIVNKMFTKDLTNAKSQTIHYGYLKYNDEIIDEVMVSIFRAPRTYTCENMVEIATHGSLIIINKVIAACVSLGAVIAERGEFTKRAYLNGRIDLIQAESINDIIHSDSEEAINIALSGLKGNVSSLVKDLKVQVEDIIANMEVNIDYPEYYDIEVETNDTILPKVNKLLNDIDIILNENTIMKVEDFPTLKENIGDELIVTDGTTLLGADDKAGIAIIMEVVKNIVENLDKEVTENFPVMGYIKAGGSVIKWTNYTIVGEEL